MQHSQQHIDPPSKLAGTSKAESIEEPGQSTVAPSASTATNELMRCSREAILLAYQEEYKKERNLKKKQIKLVHLDKAKKQSTLHPKSSVKSTRVKEIPIFKGRNDVPIPEIAIVQRKSKAKVKRLKHPRKLLAKFIPRLRRLERKKKKKDEEIHDVIWAVRKIELVMKRYMAVRVLHDNTQDERKIIQDRTVRARSLFSECCQCNPMHKAHITNKDAVLNIAGPNLPKIKQILKSDCKTSFIDLLQPHGIAQLTVLHAAAQRGYTELARELLTCWLHNDPHPSPYEPYSVDALRKIFSDIKQMRREKEISYSSFRLRVLKGLASNLKHIEFDRLQAELDRLLLLESDIELDFLDLVRVCGHPLALCVDAAGNTALHYAAEGGYLSICELLLEYGANINQQNYAGETPLHFAISGQHENVCQHFVSQKVDVNISKYVQVTLLNNLQLRGSFVDALPEGREYCKVLPVLRTNQLDKKWISRIWMGSSIRSSPRTSARRGAVRPDLSVNEQNPNLMKARLPSVKVVGDGIVARIRSLEIASPMFRNRNPRDIVYFRTCGSNITVRPNTLYVFLVGEHIALPDVLEARDNQIRSKLLHLLIRFLPQVAIHAMDTFRTPLFRCTLSKNVRFNQQRWILNNNFRTAAEMRVELLRNMQETKEMPHKPIAKFETGIKIVQTAGMVRKRYHEHQRLKRLRRLNPSWNIFLQLWRGTKKVGKTVYRISRYLSQQNLLASGQSEPHQRECVIDEPKGILYEYVYDTAEYQGGASPTLDLIIKTERKELMHHSWVTQLMDHKWHSFARAKFQLEFYTYFLYFISFFISTYLDVGDTLVGMPVGGYSSPISIYHDTWQEYVRDLGKITCSIINAYNTVQEYRSYRECGSVRAYFKDGWNWFDLVQIACVWLLFCLEMAAFWNPELLTSDPYILVVSEDSYYNQILWRQYKLRPTLLSIVGPQIFIKWIQFARGNQILGPFVRMIFKMFRDIFVFFTVFCVFLFGFAFAFFILQLEGYRSFLTAIASVFQISLGSWDWDSIYEGGPIAIVFFLMYTVMGTIMLLNLLIAMLGNTYDSVWCDRLLFYELERAKATLSMQTSLNDDEYDQKYWCRRLYVLEGDSPIEGIQLQKF